MNVDFTKFTEKANAAIRKAAETTRNSGFLKLEPEVMFAVIVNEEKDMVPFILGQFQIDKMDFATKVLGLIRNLPKSRPANSITISPTLKQVFVVSVQLAESTGCSVAALEHVFWAFLETPNVIQDIMQQYGITTDKMRQAIELYRNGSVSQPERDNYYNDESMPNLRKYGMNLVKQADEGSIDKAIGRDEEIRRILQILSRRSKNNPVLVGQPGTGKTAILEGLAYRILRGDLPQEMQGMKLYSLSISSMIAGASMQGEFEERLKKVIKEAESDPSIVLFIDEIHLLMGAGRSGGAMDAANILKPELARGVLKVIGATTLDEYRKYIEQDKAFERRFQKVNVEEPDAETAITMLRGGKTLLENHHHIKILDEAVVAAVRLSQRYITDRFLPDKAKDLLDEAASSMRIDLSSAPHDLEMLNRQIQNKEMERESVRQDGTSDESLSQLDEEIANLREQANILNAKWRNERQLLTTLQNYREQLQRIEANRDAARSQGRYSEAVNMDRQVQSIKRMIDTLTAGASDRRECLLKVALDETDIMKVVTAWTGIPMSNLTQDENEKLLHIESALHGAVVGQDAAVKAVANVIRRNRMGLSDAGKPIGTFLFLGTTGVGKTELCKALAEYLFNSRDMIVRIDMSEYQQEHSVTRLFGAPPSYVGYEDGGQLTEAVRHKPYSVVLFDEIEKAHRKVFETLLQVLDDGRMTDGKGRVVDFKNTIIIMTSNMGQSEILENLTGRNTTPELVERTKELVVQQLKQIVVPEFINRIDEIVMFQPLNLNDIKKIVKLQLEGLTKKLKTNNNIDITFDSSVIDILAEKGYVPEYGGRPVKRAINQLVVDALSMKMLTSSIDKTRNIRVYGQDGGICFRNF